MSKRHRNSLARRKPRREPYAKVLIVCEGAKTEPNYFNGLKDHYELNSANVEITGESGSSPAGIVKYAKQRYRKEKEAGDPFDKVYCVFDQDHTMRRTSKRWKPSPMRSPKQSFMPPLRCPALNIGCCCTSNTPPSLTTGKEQTVPADKFWMI